MTFPHYKHYAAGSGRPFSASEVHRRGPFWDGNTAAELLKQVGHLPSRPQSCCSFLLLKSSHSNGTMRSEPGVFLTKHWADHLAIKSAEAHNMLFKGPSGLQAHRTSGWRGNMPDEVRRWVS